MAKLLATVSLLFLACSGSPSEAIFSDAGPNPSQDPSEGLPSTPTPEAEAGKASSAPMAALPSAGAPSAQAGAANAQPGPATAGAGGQGAAGMGQGGTGSQVAGGSDGRTSAGQAGAATADGGQAGAPDQEPPPGAVTMGGRPMTWEIEPKTCWRFTAEDPKASFVMNVGTEHTPVGCVPTGLGMVMNPTGARYVVTATAETGSWVRGESEPYAGCSLTCSAKAAP